MLHPQKKVSRKEIKEDGLVTSYFEARAWAEQHQRQLLYLVGGIVVAALVAVWYVGQRSRDNELANTQLAKILPYVDQGKYELAVNGVLQEGIHGLQSIVDEYGSTKAGNIAAFYLANSYFALGQYDKALEYYKSVSVSDKMITASALAGAGACYETKKEFGEAAACYEKAALRNMTPAFAPDYLRQAAVSYAAAGKKDKAVELLKTLKKEYPSAPEAREADRFIAEFSS